MIVLIGSYYKTEIRHSAIFDASLVADGLMYCRRDRPLRQYDARIRCTWLYWNSLRYCSSHFDVFNRLFSTLSNGLNTNYCRFWHLVWHCSTQGSETVRSYSTRLVSIGRGVSLSFQFDLYEINSYYCTLISLNSKSGKRASDSAWKTKYAVQRVKKCKLNTIREAHTCIYMDDTTLSKTDKTLSKPQNKSVGWHV